MPIHRRPRFLGSARSFLIPSATSSSPKAITATSGGSGSSVCSPDGDGSKGAQSLSDYLNEHTLAAIAVELAVEDLFPGTEIQCAFGDHHHHFSPHDLPFHVGVSII